MRSLKNFGLAILALFVLTGCSGEKSAPPAPATPAQSSAAANNQGVSQVLKDRKIQSADADYIKTHMPPSSNGQAGSR